MTAKNADLHQGVEIIFADGKTRTVKPLTIRRLRDFMKIANNLKVPEDGNLTDEDIDQMVQAASIALSKADPELAANLEELEDALDLRCFQEVMAAAMGNDPNL
jgi:hypothetical protein